MTTIQTFYNNLTERVSQYQSALIAMLAVTILVALASAAQAMTAPVSGDFGYDLYDIAFNKILSGAGGWVVGGAGLALAGWAAVKQQAIPAVAAAVGTGTILKLDDMLISFGMLLQ